MSVSVRFKIHYYVCGQQEQFFWSKFFAKGIKYDVFHNEKVNCGEGQSEKFPVSPRI